MTKTKLFALSVVPVLLIAFAGAASAQPAGSPAPGAAGAAVPGATEQAPAPSSTAPATPPASDARAACAAAMNADPQFAAAVVKTADEKAAKQRDDALLAVHKDAEAHVQKNRQQVIYAYAAMWIIAAGFVLFLWRRQQALKGEIASLRRDLDAAAEESKAQPGRA